MQTPVVLSTTAYESGYVLSTHATYIKHFGCDPSHHLHLNFNVYNEDRENKEIPSFIDELLKPLYDKGFLRDYFYESITGNEFERRKVILIKNKNTKDHSMIGVDIYSHFDVYISIMGSSLENTSELRDIVSEHFNKFVVPKKEEGSYIHFICRNQDGFYTQQFEVSAGVDFENIFDNYEDEFKEKFSDVVLTKLNDPSYNKGIVLLHGEPGTGKTTYLRYVLTKVKKKVMYLPPEMGHSISDPSFITFLMHNPESILCIEDAESIIKERTAGGNQAVSNILNITDGILGSALKYQVICTFNAPFTEIDKALTRKGRMIGEYEFKPLSKSKTRNLVKKIYGESCEPLYPEMTVASIHDMKDEMPTSKKETRSMGFT